MTGRLNELLIRGFSQLKGTVSRDFLLQVFSWCPNKIIKTSLIEDFFHLPTVSTTPMVHLELRISPRILGKFETARLRYTGAWGNLIHEKNVKSNIS